MSGPSPCQNDIRACSRLDQDIAALADQTSVRNPERQPTLTGPTRSEVIERQQHRAPDTEVAKSAAKHAVIEQLVKVAQHSPLARGTVGSALRVAHETTPVFSALTLLYEGIAEYVRAHEEGGELRDGAERDAMNLAVVTLAYDALDPGYVTTVRGQLGTSEWGKDRVLTEAIQHGSGSQSFDALKATAVASAGDGVRLVQEAGCNTQRALDDLLASNSDVRNRFESDAAFRHGALSAVFSAGQALSRIANPRAG